MIFIEENPVDQAWLAGSFVLAATGGSPSLIWQDYPAPWHNKKGTISFADGHVQTTEWESTMTHRMVKLPTRISFSVSDDYCRDNPDLFKIARWYGDPKN